MKSATFTWHCQVQESSNTDYLGYIIGPSAPFFVKCEASYGREYFSMYGPCKNCWSWPLQDGDGVCLRCHTKNIRQEVYLATLQDREPVKDFMIHYLIHYGIAPLQAIFEASLNWQALQARPTPLSLLQLPALELEADPWLQAHKAMVSAFTGKEYKFTKDIGP